jgi:hypothetical protein
MIDRRELRKISKARLADSEALLRARRYDGAVYLCGYAIELALKARICQTLKWQGFPETRSEFQNLQSFKVHDLDVLLHLSGREDKIKLQNLTAWSIVVTWEPEARYNVVGSASRQDAADMISAAQTLLAVI